MIFFNIWCPNTKSILIVKLFTGFFLPALDVMNQILANRYGRVSKLVYIIFHLLESLPLLFGQANISIIDQI